MRRRRKKSESLDVIQAASRSSDLSWSHKASSSVDRSNVIVGSRILLVASLVGLLDLVRLANAGQAQGSAFLQVGEVGGQVRLPCLIGRQSYCGDPYFTAWYKLNSSSKASWTRMELESNRFSWAAEKTRGQCEQVKSQLDLTQLDCAQLTINRVEPADEGQYKCEITFSESLDVDKCPPSTLSQLNVIGKSDHANRSLR